MTNSQELNFNSFADVTIAAEKVSKIDMEFAIKWMYSVDSALEMPYQDNLNSLMSTEQINANTVA